MGDELKPVPCGCGGKAMIETVTTKMEMVPRFRVRCPECGISTVWEYFDEGEAVNAWNKAMSGHTRWSSKAIVKAEGVYCRVCGFRMDADE